MLLLIYIILSTSYSIARPVEKWYTEADKLSAKDFGYYAENRSCFHSLFLHALSAPLRSRPCCRTRRLLRCRQHPESARAALHYWEEPCISGTRGSGTVFFSGCTLKCCFCQNYPISAEGLGREITVEHLAEIFLDLQSQGAHNINLVTPGQWQPWIIAALDIARAKGLHLPILCNTGGYETVESVEAWRGYIDIWLADLKYVSSALSAELSSAPDYFAQAKPAIEAMMAQAGHPAFDAEGLLQKGVILRHLALPGHIDDSFAVLDQMAAWNDADPGCFIPSVMSQYTPFYKAAEHGIGRRITTYEYRRVVNYAMDKGLAQGYMQQKSSAKEEYTPSFDLTGV